MSTNTHSMGHHMHGAGHHMPMSVIATTMSTLLANITMQPGMDSTAMSMKDTVIGHEMHGVVNVTMGREMPGLSMTQPSGAEHHQGHGAATDSPMGHDHDSMGSNQNNMTHDYNSTHGDHDGPSDEGHNHSSHGGHGEHANTGHDMEYDQNSESDHEDAGHDHSSHGGHSEHTNTGHDMEHDQNSKSDHDEHADAGRDKNLHSDHGSGHDMSHGQNSNTKGTHAGHATGHTMYFNMNLPIHVLFFGWEVTSQGQLAGACVAWLVLAILYEGLKSFRDYILAKSIRSERKYLVRRKGGDSEEADGRSSEPSCLKKMCNGWHLLLSFLQIIHTILGMFLMLVFMTFNVWLALSVSLGSGVGYFLFAWNKRSVMSFDEDHCT